MVDVLLAVYNGEKYLREQLYSVLAQDYRDFRILARDDGSSDSSREILAEFEREYPQKVKVIRTETYRHSAADNFFELMKHSDAEYTMFCDQDDFWDYNKISVTLAEMKKHPSDIPVLVHTDLAVADENLNIMFESFNAGMELDAKNITLEKLLTYNCVTGCTVMINKALRELARNAPKGLIMHDWWLALCAEIFGELVYLDTSTMLYRQHSGNVIGAEKKTVIDAVKQRLELHDKLYMGYLQADRFLREFKGKIPNDKKKIIRGYAVMPMLNKFERAVNILRFGYTKSTALKTVGQILLS